ncbi:MAG: orotidine-5'-phosphate decarboxylase [Proteobacteria bacterium]|nr:orotidine-5'-phosphate decarboxylase [Cystobacterineae bacterium]MCL2313924.1 orotidine-5'-phosphate decarboxylase [Pseudomonadota bacterium]
MSDAPAKLVLAADFPLNLAQRLYSEVAVHLGVVKVGLSLFVEHGPKAVEVFRKLGARVFLDLKLHDIPNTVHLAAQRAAAMGVDYLTVHAFGGKAMLCAALEGAAKGAAQGGHLPPQLLAVTVLTSMGGADMEALGVLGGVGGLYPQVERLALLAHEAGVGGVVCSVEEAAALRQRLGKHMVLCTPGIRPRGVQKADQCRTQTPRQAILSGADLLVVGRPVYEAEDPKRAASLLEAEVAEALEEARVGAKPFPL